MAVAVTEYDVRVILAQMPARIRSYVVLMDGFYTIVLNDDLSPMAKHRAYCHEMEHIENGDFERSVSADLLEVRVHGIIE